LKTIRVLQVTDSGLVLEIKRMFNDSRSFHGPETVYCLPRIKYLKLPALKDGACGAHAGHQRSVQKMFDWNTSRISRGCYKNSNP
jgi:hypothetical protein